MALVNDANVMKVQYASDANLKVRMALHQKYSVQKQPFAEWIMEHYGIQPGMLVLELGCGNGSMWKQPDAFLPEDAELILTDFSEGMLEAARGNVPKRPNISFAQVDIQHIPYPDGSFDLVIANMMLYHVPDLPRALAEVARVMKPGGRFICATVGEHGVSHWLESVLGVTEGKKYPFSLQNGMDQLSAHFGRIDMDVREDGLRVTETADLAAYVLSMASFSGLKAWPYDRLYALLDHKKANGVIRIPKEYGLFQCYEPIVTKIFD